MENEKNNLFETRDVLKRVIAVVAEYFHQDYKLLFTPTRKRDVVIARQTAMYFLKVDMGYSFKFTGNVFRRDHTTVIHAISAVEDLRDTDRTYKTQFTELRNFVYKILGDVKPITDGKETYEDLLDQETEDLLSLKNN